MKIWQLGHTVDCIDIHMYIFLSPRHLWKNFMRDPTQQKDQGSQFMSARKIFRMTVGKACMVETLNWSILWIKLILQAIISWTQVYLEMSYQLIMMIRCKSTRKEDILSLIETSPKYQTQLFLSFRLRNNSKRIFEWIYYEIVNSNYFEC